MNRFILSVSLFLSMASCASLPTLVEGDLLITRGLVVDTETGTVTDPMDILVANGQIVRIARSGEIDYSNNVRVINADGLFLLPGFIDVHAHIGSGGLYGDTDQDREKALAQFVSYGVTSIFAPGGGGGNDKQLANWKRYCGAEQSRCPRLFGSGTIITAYGSHPITTIWGFPADVDLAVARARGAIGITERDSVDDLIEEKVSAGVDALKIVVEDGPGPFAPKPRLSSAKIAEICSKAHRQNLRVYAHVSLANHVVDVVDGGCDGIMHAPDDVLSDDTLQKMADRGVYYVATLSLFDALMDQGAGRRQQDDYALAGVASKALESLQDDEYWGVEKESPELIAEWQDALNRNLRRANELGVPIALGTDTNNPQIFPGYAVHEELELMVEAGLSEAEALESATITAARFLEEERLGRIKEGFYADIVALRENPFDEIQNTRTISFVLIGGDKVQDVVSLP